LGEIQSGEAKRCAELTALGRRPSSSDTIGDIQRAAKQEFAARGFDSTTVDGIARRAKVSKQLLYYYFGSKADLYRLVLEEAAVETITFSGATRYDDLSPAAAIGVFIDDAFSDFIKRPQIVQMTVDEAKHAFAHVSKSSPLARVLQDAIRALGKILLRGQDAGEFKNDVDPDALFWTIFAMATAWFSHNPMISLVSGEKLKGAPGMDYWQKHSEAFILNFISEPVDRTRTR
jgi:TetR/AcrR family transcriptional regulator